MSNQQIDTATGKPAIQDNTGGAAHVTLVNQAGTEVLSGPAATIVPVADKTPLMNGAVLLLSAQNLNRKAIIIRSAKANVNKMRIGNASITATLGIELNPGDTITLETTAAVYAKNLIDVTSSTPAQTLSILELI